MRLLSLTICAVMALGASAARAAFECLDSSGPLTVVAGDHGYDRFRVSSRNAPDQTKFDARGAIWNTQIYPEVRQAYPVFLDGPDGGCWLGGSILGTNDPDAFGPTIYSRANSAAIIWGAKSSTRNFTVDGVRIDNAWDGLRVGRLADNFEIRNVWMTYTRDDCIENDFHRSGLVYRSLLDGCSTAFSSRNIKSSYNGSQNIWTIEQTLIRLEPMPGSSASSRPVHAVFFKWEGNGNRIRLIKNIFYVEQGAGDYANSDPFGNLSWSRIVESRDNIVVWAGSGEYRWPLPSGFTVTNDERVWDRARADWLRDHAEVAEAAGCLSDDACLGTEPRM